jgi:hypothetical protein
METKELIQALRADAEWAHANEWETPITLGDHLDAAADALAALREQAERSKGCDYCLSTWPDRAADGFSDIWHKNKLSVGYGVYREIKFCPMCGKRLEEHNEAD